MKLLDVLHVAAVNLMLHQLVDARTVLQLDEVRRVDLDAVFRFQRFEHKRDQEMVEKSIAALDFLRVELRVDGHVADVHAIVRLVLSHPRLRHTQRNFEAARVLRLDQLVQLALGDVFGRWNFRSVADVDEKLFLRSGFECFDANPCG